jgi:hypothetical protein
MYLWTVVVASLAMTCVLGSVGSKSKVNLRYIANNHIEIIKGIGSGAMDSSAKLHRYAVKARKHQSSVSSHDRDHILTICQGLVTSQDSTVLSTATVLWSLGTLRFNIRDSDTRALVGDMTAQLADDHKSIGSQSMALTLVGLAKMGTQNNRQLAPLLLSLAHAVCQMDGKQLANTIWALGVYI